MMEAYTVTMLSLLGLCAALVAWLMWTGRRDFRAYRRWCGGRWGCVRELTHWGMNPLMYWMPEDEIHERGRVVEWEEWPRRTRVRGKRGDR